MRMKRLFMIFALLSLPASLCGCTTRPVEPSVPAATEAPASDACISFYSGDQLLTCFRYSDPASIEVPESNDPALRIVGWTYNDGNPADPLHPSTEDETVYAEVRPILNDSPYLSADDNGCIRPEDPITYSEMENALDILLEGIDYSVDFTFAAEDGDSTVSSDSCVAVLRALCDPTMEPSISGETVTRGAFAVAVEEIRGITPSEKAYFPDNSPDSPCYDAVNAAGFPGSYTPDSYSDKAIDGYLWLNGYLYRWDEANSCFLTSAEYDGLWFDGNGRYSCGNTALDAYVAQTISEYCDLTVTREENLRTLYQHVKNDFKYLPRNYYESGETGWDIREALTMFETGKGNCYCFTGAFCALARGLGYNAITWSGTMGTENQPHAWTEITIAENVYICDPEIELNYWLLEMYTDNFMMPKSLSGGWNYQAAGRDNSIPAS